MEFNYALYDALVSINVPSEKARTVVEAMERDMGTTLATKTDLLLLGERLLRTEQSLDSRIDAVEQRLGARIDTVEQKLGARTDAVEQKLGARIDAIDQRIAAAVTTIAKDMEMLRSSMVVRLGSIQVVTLGLLFAALKLT